MGCCAFAHIALYCGLRQLADARSAYPNKKRLACTNLFLLGRVMGIEPTTFGTTTRRSNQLS